MKPQHDNIECERLSNFWGLIALLLTLAAVACFWLILHACLLQHPRLAFAAMFAMIALWCARSRAKAIAGYWEDCRLRNMADEADRKRI